MMITLKCTIKLKIVEEFAKNNANKMNLFCPDGALFLRLLASPCEL